MRSMLLILSALAIAASAWAENEPKAPAAAQAAAPEAAKPAAQVGVVIELKGQAKQVSALEEALEKDAAYKDAGCSARHAKKSTKISCARADSALMAFLVKNAEAVRWSIASVALPRVPAVNAMKMQSLTGSVCNSPCKVMACPPPGGTTQCCTTSYPYKPC